MKVTPRVKFLLKVAFVSAVAAVSFNLGNYSATEAAKATIEEILLATPNCKSHAGEFILPHTPPKQKYNI